MNRKAFTMVEMIVVVGIMSLVLIPTYRILSHGSKSAIDGVSRGGIILEGQQILGQVKSDLNSTCFVYSDGNERTINNLFKEKITVTEITYSFLSFSGGKANEKVVSTTFGPESPRRLNEIEYKLISRKNSPFKTLERTLRLHPKNDSFGGKHVITKVLSNKVNFFEINPVTVTSCGVSRSFFRISLLLFDKKEGQKIEVGADGSVDGNKVFIADFSATVSPIILNTILDNPGLNRNWYTDTESPDPKIIY